MGLVVCGDEVNTAGNPVHFTGLAWAGEHGRPIDGVEPREVTTASGACLALPAHLLQPFELVVVFDDRVVLQSDRPALQPQSHREVDILVVEEEPLGKAPEVAKRLQWLERNRWAFVLRCYPGALLLLLAPALLLTELALIPLSVTGGWGRQKLLANIDGMRQLP
jgi:hypothetical protein